MKTFLIYSKNIYIINSIFLTKKLFKIFKNKKIKSLTHSPINKSDYLILKDELINFQIYLIKNTNEKNYNLMLKYIKYLIKNNLIDPKIFFEKLFFKLKIKKKNERVFYCKDKYPYPSNALIWILYIYAIIYNIPICRLCLHNLDKNKINSMIMIHAKNQIVGPLKQHKKFISYHIIFGYIQIGLIEKSKKQLFNLKANGDNKNLLIPANIFRTINSLSSPSIFLEVAEGPFKDSDTIWKF